MDIVIPLSNGSNYNNEELRLSLRCIDKLGKNIDNIHIVTDCLPSWVKGVNVIVHGDSQGVPKDSNIINKILAACRRQDVSDNFIFWSDDQLILHPFDVDKLKPIFNNRGILQFSKDGNVWQQRMHFTLDYLRMHGHPSEYNWDSHVPTPYNKEAFMDLVGTLDYTSRPGFCINTIYYGLLGQRPEICQRDVKCTIEKLDQKIDKNMLYLGYNDKIFESGVIKDIRRMFPNKSRYEK